MHSRNTLVLCALSSLVFAGCTAPVADEEVGRTESALTLPALEWAYGWTQDASTGAISPSFQASSSGGAVTGRRLAVGHYEAQFAGLGATAGGNVQVVAYGSNARCNVQNWGGLPLKANVRCFAPNGTAVDSRYVVSYVRDDRTSFSVSGDRVRAAYVWHSGISTPGESLYRWSSNGGTVTVTNTAPGKYRVTIAGGATGPLPPGNLAQVTAYGLSNTYCTSAGWHDDAPPEEPAVDRAIEVRCFNPSGAPANSAFSLRYWTWGSFGGREGAWAFDANPYSASPVTPTSTHWDNSGGAGVPTITRASLGNHDVLIPGRTMVSSGALANAVAEDGRYCNIGHWSAVGSTVTVRVRCFAASGAPADTEFTAAYLDGVVGP